mmetsp:Transcript_82705/g.230635  ORF Transcript_82705/g.230635 Transcript_82705/m.230635 type:complete len:231 (+) Transcript_82705:751-1443(+)
MRTSQRSGTRLRRWNERRRGGPRAPAWFHGAPAGSAPLSLHIWHAPAFRHATPLTKSLPSRSNFRSRSARPPIEHLHPLCRRMPRCLSPHPLAGRRPSLSWPSRRGPQLRESRRRLRRELCRVSNCVRNGPWWALRLAAASASRGAGRTNRRPRPHSQTAQLPREFRWDGRKLLDANRSAGGRRSVATPWTAPHPRENRYLQPPPSTGPRGCLGALARCAPQTPPPAQCA